MTMTRAELQQLAEERLLDAQALLAAQRWSATYYLAGYAVECGLKSCVLAYLAGNMQVIFTDRRFSEKCWTHDFNGLVTVAGLKAAQDVDIAANKAFEDNWETVLGWKESSRYQRFTQEKAEKLFAAITNNPNGVLPWIKGHW